MSKHNPDIINLLRRFQTAIDNKPPVDQMYAEVRMMKFKIKPVKGDVSFIDLKNENLIEVLWRLGKLDDFFHRFINTLNEKDKNIFMDFFENMHERYQKQLNHINLKTEKTITEPAFFEMEIFKERFKKNKVN